MVEVRNVTASKIFIGEHALQALPRDTSPHLVSSQTPKAIAI